MNEAQLAQFWKHISPEPNSGCWLWTGATRMGYGAITLSDGGKSKMWCAHRLAYTHYKGPIPAGHYMCHRCDVRECCNPDHLFPGTQAENMADMTRKGRRGGKRVAHRTKLAEEKVHEVRRLRAAGKLAREITAETGVHIQTVFMIIANRQYKWLKTEGLSSHGHK